LQNHITKACCQGRRRLHGSWRVPRAVWTIRSW
jgi:hypothetical protein